MVSPDVRFVKQNWFLPLTFPPKEFAFRACDKCNRCQARMVLSFGFAIQMTLGDPGTCLPLSAIDATGNNKSMVRSFEFAAFAGRVVYVGITQQNVEVMKAVIHIVALTG